MFSWGPLLAASVEPSAGRKYVPTTWRRRSNVTDPLI